MTRIHYEAEKLTNGYCLDLYRSIHTDDGELTFEKYVIEKHAWVEDGDARAAFLGYLHTSGISEEEAMETIAIWEENYAKYLAK